MEVIIPTKNSEIDLGDCLEALNNQTIPVDVIIVDARSTDRTLEIARNYGAKIYQEPPSITKGSRRALACNMGLLNSSSPIVGFIDSDTITPPNWAEDLSGSLDEGVAAVTSGCISGVGGPLQRCISRILKFGSDSHGRKFDSETPVKSAGGYNAVYRRKVLNEVGFFAEDIGGCEDWELNYRIRKAGYKIMGIPSSPVEHRERRTFKSFCKQMFGYGWSRSRLAKVKGLFTISHALPTVFLILMIALFMKIPAIILSLMGCGIFTWIVILVIEILLWGEMTADVIYQPFVVMTFLVSWAFGYIKGFID